MRKIIKFVIVFMIIVFAFVALGCGGNRFEGKWYSLVDNTKNIDSLIGNSLVEMEIVEMDDGTYNVYMSSSSYHRKDEYDRNLTVTCATFYWDYDGRSEYFTARDGGKNRIVVDKTTAVITYDDKEDVLYVGNIAFKKFTEKEFEKFKENEKARLYKAFEDKHTGVVYVRDIKFVN